MIIIILIGAIFIGLMMAGVIAPILMLSNKSKLKRMDQLIEKFESKNFSSTEEKDQARQALKKELIKIKSAIATADKKAVMMATDKISIL